MAEREKVIEALRICREGLGTKSCRKCPYMRGRDGTGTCYPIDAEENGVHLCWQDLVEDAIALLKEQEPRVLDWNEIGTVDGAVWLEDRDENEVVPGLVMQMYSAVNLDIKKDGKPRIASASRSDYGDRWRAWSARPTEEQRKAAKWDEWDET